MPKTGYFQGVPRMLTRTGDKFDYPFPEFQHIGEEPIFNYEIFPTGTDDSDEWGYKPRYAEWKFIPDTIHGEFKTTLDFWTMTRNFAGRPALNKTFIYTEDIDTICDRIFAISGAEHFYATIQNDVKVKRKLALYGDPKII